MDDTVEGFSDRPASPDQFTAETCKLHLSTPNYDAKLVRTSLEYDPGEVLPEKFGEGV